MPILDPKLYKGASGKMFPRKMFPTNRYFHLFFSENFMFLKVHLLKILAWGGLALGMHLWFTTLSSQVKPRLQALSMLLDFNLIILVQLELFTKSTRYRKLASLWISFLHRDDYFWDFSFKTSNIFIFFCKLLNYKGSEERQSFLTS